MSGTLYIVATPIGNLEDLTPRARRTLEEVDLIAAEDTRHTRRLLSHFGIKTPLLTLHDHNEARLAETVVADLLAGKSIALVSDAGTPLLSDPGYRLVRDAHRQGIALSPVPGASALTAALSVAGLPTDRFCFEGFLPAKQKARRVALEALAAETRTMVFYESVHRVRESIADLIDAFGSDRQAFIGRELTKLHEQVLRAPLGDLQEKLVSGEITEKGEFVMVVGGASKPASATVDTDRLLIELADRLPSKEIAKVLARATGESRNSLYKRLLQLGKDTDGSKR
jgi:16S rRNA (cytidine1402-2'-O)-methyltransferase